MKKGPAQLEMEMLLETAFAPTRLSVINDSAKHMVNKALGDIPGTRVHALAIKASAPGEI